MKTRTQILISSFFMLLISLGTTVQLQADGRLGNSIVLTNVVIDDIIITNPTCGLSNGVIEIIATPSPGGSVANLTYELNLGVYSQTGDGVITGLDANMYFITVEDEFGCFSNAEIANLVNEDAPLSVTGNIDCQPDGNINIDVTTSGGSPAYAYSWTGPGGFTAMSEDLMGVSTGTYDVTVTGTSGCTGTASFTMDLCTSGMANVCEATVKNPECVGDSNGSIIMMPNTTPPYTYQWAHISGPGSNFISGLNAGDYTVTVTDGTGATAECSYTLIAPTEMTIDDVVITQPSCVDGDGIIDLRVTPSVTASMLMYSIDGGVSFQSSSVFNNISSGDYFIAVRDEHGCQVTDFAKLQFDSQGLTATSQGGCESPDNIFVDAMVTGGTTPYTYAWSGDGGFTSTDLNIPSAPVGTYVLTVTDAVGCTASTNITLTNCCSFDNLCSATVIDAQCGVTGGSIEVNPISDITPFSYAWQHDPTLTGNSATNLISGVYNVTVTDGNGCNKKCTFQVGDGTSVSIGNVDIVNATCGLSNGSISIGLSTVPACAIEYSIDGGNTYQASELFSNLAAGNYMIMIKDCNDCTDTGDIAEVRDDAGPTVEIDMLMCTPSGTIDAFVTTMGGSTPYTYSWTGASGFTATTEDLIDVLEGTYNLTVTDANGCTATITATQTGCTPPDLCVASFQNPVCSGDGTGVINITPQGGGSFTYAWSHDANVTTSNATGLSEGSYFVTVTNGAGISEVCSYTLTAPQSIEVNVVNAQCTPFGNISIDIGVMNGTGPYSYAWTGPGGYSSTSEDLTEVAQGSYTVVVTDAAGCNGNQTITLNDCTAPDLCTATLENPDCTGEDSGEIVISPQGAPPFTYNWSHDASLNSNTAVGLAAGNYLVTVTAQNGFQDVCSYDLVDPSSIEILVNSAECTLAGNISIDISATNGIGTYMYNWTGPNGFSSTTEDITNVPQGTYTVAVNDGNGCVSMVSITEDGCIAPDLCSNFNLEDPTCRGESTGSIQVNPLGGTPPYTYTWSHDASVTGNSATGLSAGNYRVTIVDASGFQSACSYDLEDPDELFILDFAVTDPDCNDPNGSIELILGVLTGSGSSPYTGSGTGVSYSINNGSTFQPTASFMGLSAGTYQAVVQDPNGCVSPVEIISLNNTGDCNSVGDFVWDDLNGNGVQDFNEPGVEDVQVELYDSNGAVLAATYTDANGQYSFQDLSGGFYYVKVKLPDGYEFTVPNSSTSDNNDSDMDNSNGVGTTTLFHLGPNEDDLSWDIGMHKCIEVGDLVWLDFNHNELQDPNENGVNGIKVEIYKQQAGGYVLYDYDYTAHKPNTPSDDGYYKMCVPPGTYYLRYVVNQDFLVPVNPDRGSDDIDSDITGAFGSNTTNSFTVLSGQMNCDMDAGFYPASSLGDKAWVDDNRNGQQDAGEPPLAGVKVDLLKPDGSVLESTNTDINGRYSFNDVVIGDYMIKFNPPVGYTATIANIGTDEKMDSDINYSNTTSMIKVEECEIVTNIDAGFVQGIVLPLELVRFDGEYQGSHNLLTWETANEINTDYFELERLYENQNAFEAITKKPAENSSSDLNKYEYNDYEIARSGTYYYRLKQYDNNGDYTYSNVIAIAIGEEERDVDYLNIYPNPADGDINVSFFTDVASAAEVGIYDITGKAMLLNGIAMEAVVGVNTLTIDVRNIPQGTYTIRVKQGGRITSNKFVKL